MATTLQVEPPQPPLRRRRWALGLSVAALVVVLAWPVTSYVRALTYPGQASLPARTAEWVHDQPDHATPPDTAQVPPPDRGGRVAIFNSGFTMAGARGGFLADGRTVGPPRPGSASVVIGRDGSATVGQWDRDVSLSSGVVAVRQNLDLTVDKSRAVKAPADNSGNRWGRTKNQVQYTRRWGLGVDAAGNLVSVGGSGLNLVTLAGALRAVRGMPLDIHNDMVAFLAYPSGAAHVLGGVKLLPDMPGSLDRYLVPDERDFFVVTLR
jgi:hypothetical protein